MSTAFAHISAYCILTSFLMFNMSPPFFNPCFLSGEHFLVIFREVQLAKNFLVFLYLFLFPSLVFIKDIFHGHKILN